MRGVRRHAITLPRPPRRRTPEPPPPVIVIVEPASAVRQQMEELFEAEGYDVRVVDDARAAAGLFAETPPDLVIIAGPESEQFSLLGSMRNSTSYRDVPTILIAESRNPAHAALGLEFGADDYLARPIHLAELLARVHVHLRHAARRKQLQRYAIVDPLTSVLNRRGILGVVDHELERMRAGGPSFALLMVDVNDFKSINDEYGHDVGDLVLRQVASALSEQVRSEDLVGRFGGDEFLVMVPAAGQKEAMKMQRRIGDLSRAAALRELGIEAPVTVAIGATTARAADSAEELVRRADRAMYRDKRRSS